MANPAPDIATDSRNYQTDLYRFMDVASSVLISSLDSSFQRNHLFPVNQKDASRRAWADGTSANQTALNISLFNSWTSHQSYSTGQFDIWTGLQACSSEERAQYDDEYPILDEKACSEPLFTPFDGSTTNSSVNDHFTWMLNSTESLSSVAIGRLNPITFPLYKLMQAYASNST